MCDNLCNKLWFCCFWVGNGHGFRFHKVEPMLGEWAAHGQPCHTPILGPTRMADPNRVRGARLYTGTLYLFFFSLRAELITESKYHIQNKTTTVVVFTVPIHTISSSIYLYIYNNNFTFPLHIQSTEPTVMNP